MYNKVHIIQPSPWPFFTSIHLGCFFIGLSMYLNRYYGGKILILLSIILLSLDIFSWYTEIIKESVFLGTNTSEISNSLLMGFILFVISEALIFLTFFLIFFYISFFPSIETGAVFPPMGIPPIPFYSVPFVNTLLLLAGSFSATAFLYAFSANLPFKGVSLLLFSIFCNLYFSYLQFIEYFFASFSISSGIWGSLFFILTGLHGFHVFCGTFLLLFVFFRFLLSHFSTLNLFFPSISSSYIHFVDFIWLFLYTFFYCFL